MEKIQLHKALFLLCNFSGFVSISNAQELKNRLYETVYTEAYFQSGKNDWISYVQQKVNAEIPTLYCAPVGVYCVEARFLVNKDGSLADIRPLTQVGFGMEEEVVRVVKGAPNWIPATQNGRKVRTYKCVSYLFVVKNTESGFL